MGPTEAHISHRNLKHNISLIRSAIGKRKIMAVVKANAYGHGDIEISKSAVEAGCEYLGVAFVEEGIKLREAGFDTPILVFGAHSPELLLKAIDYNLEITLTNLLQIDFLNTLPAHSKVTVHIKFDTGMNRVGFPYTDFQNIIDQVQKIPCIVLKGIYSHFSTSDESNTSFTEIQIERFNKIRDYAHQVGNTDIIFHMANSGAIMQHPDSYFDLVRPGIMLYGQPPSPDFNLTWDLREVMALQSRLGLVKLTEKNEPVSYGRRYYTNTQTYIGVIPAGYADGISRAHTNNGNVLINNKCYPIVGTVCMDMIMIDLGAETECKTGDIVTIYGGEIPIRDVAKRIETIPYEVTCNVSQRVPRIHNYE
jgi:alanine racemase